MIRISDVVMAMVIAVAGALLLGCDPTVVEVPGDVVVVEVPGEAVVIGVPGATEVVEVPGSTEYVEVPGSTEVVEVETCPTFLLPGLGGPVEVSDLLVSETSPEFFHQWTVQPWVDVYSTAPEGCGGVILRDISWRMSFPATAEEMTEVESVIENMPGRWLWLQRSVAPPNGWENIGQELFQDNIWSDTDWPFVGQMSVGGRYNSLDWEVPPEDWHRLSLATAMENVLPTDRMVSLTIHISWQLVDDDSIWYSTSHGATIHR